MRELVGSCSKCGKDLFCLDGFFAGVQTEDKKIICFDCNENKENTTADE
ncbi:hypothetical protein [Neobacillus terrae]|nr:hypothetical protein [Neobacillus terrae]NHM29181.1 hypothetical protein [Neobacillus terrae]